MQLPHQRRLYRAFYASLFVGVALYAASVAVGDLQAVGAAMGAMGVAGWGLVLGLSLVNYGLRFLRWQGFLIRLGHPVPGIPSALCYLGGFAFTTTPGKAGEAVRSLYLKRYGVGYSDSLAALFVERLMDLTAIMLLSALVVSAFPPSRVPVALLALGLLSLLPALRSRTLMHRADRWRRDLKRPRLREGIGHLIRMLGQSARLIENRPLYVGLGLGLLAWGAEGVGLYLILILMGVDIAPTMAIGIYSVSILVGALSFIPGGLGSTETAMGLMLTLAGADLSTAVSATLVCRLATLWFAVAIGLACLGALELVHRRRATGTSEA
jgi:uncharacterized protein (TIRG00374 family)